MTSPSYRSGPAAAWVVLALLVCPLAGTGAAAAIDSRLADAARAGDAATVRSLLQQGIAADTPGRDGTPALHWAVYQNDLEIVRLLIDAGASVLSATPVGATPLYLAASSGYADILQLLLERGADPNATDWTGEPVLMTAARAGVADAVRRLLDAGAEVERTDRVYLQTALIVAIRENHPAVVRLLIERGANVETQTRAGNAPRWTLPNSVPGFSHGEGIVRGGLPERGSRAPIPGGMTPLLYAARDGRIEIVRMLLEAGADPNGADANGIAPLISAVSNNQVPVAHALIQGGADIHARDWYGRSALWTAVETRNMDVDNASFVNSIDRDPFIGLIRVLLERGADPDVRSAEVPPVRRAFLRVTGSLAWVDFTGQTPFLTAALAGDVTVMRLLLAHGADPHLPTFAGTTALMAAAGINWVYDQTYDEGPEALLEAVRLCWELGMDVNAVNSMGLRAIHGAANRGSDDIIRFLVEKGARLDVADNEGRTPLTWAEGVFLATHPAKPKPSSIALLRELMASTAAAGR